MHPLVRKLLDRLGQSKVLRPRRRPARLAFDVLEDRTVPTTLGSVSGAVYINSLASPVVGETVTLFGPGTATLTAVTDSAGAFSFVDVGPGTYKLQAAPLTGLIGTMSLGDVTASPGVTIENAVTVTTGAVNNNIVVNGGLAPNYVSVALFLTETVDTGYVFNSAPGAGQAPNPTPIETNAFTDQVLNTSASITNASESGNIVTITTAAAHNFQVGQTVAIASVATTGYNGTFIIGSVTSTTFTYFNPGSSGLATDSAGGGTASIAGSEVIDLAGHFGDAAITDSSITMNITEDGVAKKLNITLNDTTAPEAVANFFDYINSGFYNNDFFFRSTNTTTDGIEVLQAGGLQITNGTGPNSEAATGPDIPDEISALNTAGTLAMANNGTQNSSSDQFFFNTTDDPSLDHATGASQTAQGYTVFGEVSNAASQAVLDSLSAIPVNNLSSPPSGFTAPSGFLVNEVPLTGGSSTTFPTNSADYIVINGITINKRTDFLTYTAASSDTNVATVSIQNEQLTVTSVGRGTSTITVTATDQFGASLTETFTVGTPTLAPSGTSNTITIAENTPYTFKASDFGFSDPNTPANTLAAVEITTVPTAGTLTNDATGTPVTVTAGTFVPVANINAGDLVFTPATGATGSPYDSFTFQVQSTGSTADGGVNTDPTARTMTFDVIVPTLAPSGASNTVTLGQNGTYTFQTGDFGFSDPNTPANTLAAVEITTVPTNGGTLTDDFSGTPVTQTAGTFVPVSHISAGDLVFTPAAGDTSNPDSSFTFQVESTGSTAAGGVNVDPTARTMTIAPNQPPSGTSETINVAANGSYTFAVSDFGYSDPNNPANSLENVIITSAPANGGLTDSASGTPVAVTSSTPVPVGDITGGNLVYTPPAGASGTAYDSFTFQVQNNGGTANGGVDTDPTPRLITVNIT